MSDWKWLSEIEECHCMAGFEACDAMPTKPQVLHLISIVREMRSALEFYANGKSKMLLWHEDDLAVAKATLARCKDGKLE